MSQFFAWGGQSIGVSASVLPKNTSVAQVLLSQKNKFLFLYLPVQEADDADDEDDGDRDYYISFFLTTNIWAHL